jgi:prephenate dehydrogenase
MTVAVIGLGMIGGSVARGLAEAGIRIVGFDRDRYQLEAAVSDGVVSEGLSDLDDLHGATTAVIAVYGDGAPGVLRNLEKHAGSLGLVIDVGSTKKSIVEAAERSSLADHFVGAHPFAGDHRSGWAASRANLFENELVYLSPSSRSTHASIELAKKIWQTLGARTEMIGAAEHDRAVAWTSHLPHVLSTAFAITLSRAGIAPSQLGRGGRDVARLAGGSPEMWSALAADNAHAIDSALSETQLLLDDFRGRLGDKEKLADWFTQAREWTSSS